MNDSTGSPERFTRPPIDQVPSFEQQLSSGPVTVGEQDGPPGLKAFGPETNHARLITDAQAQVESALNISVAPTDQSVPITAKAIPGEIRAGKETAPSPEKKAKVLVRQATLDDISRLAEIDLARFRKAYGEEIPPQEQVEDMLRKRLLNNPGWMFVAEVNGAVEGFVSAFRTDRPLEQFTSWEDSTANGTLDGKVVADGKYVYVTNMTINPVAVKNGGESMLIANLFANGIRDGIIYGYFVSRMPQFAHWVQRQVKTGELDENMTAGQLLTAAETYMGLTKETRTGTVRKDFELRMYEQAGFELIKTVPGAFSDAASLDFGVICKANVPPKNHLFKSIKPLRMLMAGGLRALAKKPKLLERFF